jgi:large subunit ribosomal protein L13
MKTYSAKPSDVTRVWYVIDAVEAPLGRVATRAASLLLGKGKTQYTKHIDCGDFVIIINSDKLVVTGNKFDNKLYHKHSGFPGGLTTKTLQQVVDADSTKAIFSAVRGMLPVNKLRDARLARLKIYSSAEHGHQAQKPITINLSKETK